MVNSSGAISTIAGGGGSTGEGAPATLARLYNPRGIAVDASGNLFIAESHRVRKVAPDGLISTVAGNGTGSYNYLTGTGDAGPALSAYFGDVWGVAVDTLGNLFIADMTEHNIRKVTASGTISRFAGGSAVLGDISGFSGDGGPAIKARLLWPRGVAVDTAGNILIADAGNNVIRKCSMPDLNKSVQDPTMIRFVP